MIQVKTEDVRFCSNGKMLFWIPKYYLDERAYFTIRFAQLLVENVKAFAEFAQVDENTISSFEIQHSRTLKYYRVYQTSMQQCPDGITPIPIDLDIRSWIEQ